MPISAPAGRRTLIRQFATAAECRPINQGQCEIEPESSELKRTSANTDDLPESLYADTKIPLRPETAGLLLPVAMVGAVGTGLSTGKWQGGLGSRGMPGKKKRDRK